MVTQSGIALAVIVEKPATKSLQVSAVFGTHEKRVGILQPKHLFAWVWGEIARVLQHQNNKYTFCKHTIPPQYGLKYAFWPMYMPYISQW